MDACAAAVQAPQKKAAAGCFFCAHQARGRSPAGNFCSHAVKLARRGMESTMAQRSTREQNLHMNP
jgi:hypothetical protein